MTSIDVTITSGRTLTQGRTMEKGKTRQDYEDAVAICELDETAMQTLGLEKDDVVLVQTDLGKTYVKSKLNKNLHPGLAFIPCGPYFNEIIGSDTNQSGMPNYKTVKATISAAKGSKVKPIAEFPGRVS